MDPNSILWGKKFKKSFRQQASTVFWDSEGAIFADARPRRKIIHFDERGKKPQKAFQFRPYKNPTEICLQHDKASPHRSFTTREAIKKCGWTVLPPSSLQPRSSTCRFPPTWSPEGRNPKFHTEDDVICPVRTWLYKQDKAQYQRGISNLVPRRHKAVEVEGDFVEKFGMYSKQHS